MFLQGKINLRDYSDIEKIEIKNDRSYLNGDLIDFYYLDVLRNPGSSYFYAKDNNNLVICGIFCGFDKFVYTEDIRAFPFGIFNDNHKFKYLL